MVAIAGGHALAGFTMSGINPYYLEKRWASPKPLAERPEPVVEYQTIATDFAASAGSRHLFNLPEPAAFKQPPAGQDDWREPDLEPFAEEKVQRERRRSERFPLDEGSTAEPIGQGAIVRELPADSGAEQSQPGQSGVTMRRHTDRERGTPSIVETGSEISEQ
jgi:hypothetical protein